MSHISQRTIAVIPTFNPEPTLVARCSSLLDEVDGIVIVDDGSSHASAATILDDCESLGCFVYRNATNEGIAAALNMGVSLCRESQAEFVLTLDQDTVVPPGYVSSMVKTWNQAQRAGIRPGLICPEKVNATPTRGDGHLKTFALGGEPIQSGLLIPVKTFDLVGSFNAALFIDCVETEFFLRMRLHDMMAVQAIGTDLKHSLGKTCEVQILGITIKKRGAPIKQFYSAKFRYYYISRNRTRLYLTYGPRFPKWAIHSITEEIAHQLRVVLFLPGRSAHIRISLIGLWDGLRGVGGPIPRNAVRICRSIE